MRTKVKTIGNQTVLVDEDCNLLDSTVGWFINSSNGKRRYVRKDFYVNGKKVNRYLHRMIMGLQDGDKRQIDHLNRDTFDNRRENLRICSQSTNLLNRGLDGRNSSGYSGVWFNKYRNKWQVTFKRRGYYGLFPDKEEAIKVRKELENEG